MSVYLSIFIRTALELSYLDYTMNNKLEKAELEQIAKHWNRDDLQVFFNT
jgi:hypothetical protein